MLDAAARRYGRKTCRGLFIEAEHPDRTPPDILAAEQETAVDAWERWRVFHHFGFRRVHLQYVQPPLAEDMAAVDYLELLFHPWDNTAHESARIPATWVLDSVLPIWGAWAPRTYQPHYDVLRQQLGANHVALRPLLDASTQTV